MTTYGRLRSTSQSLAWSALLALTAAAPSQRLQTGPVTDSAAQASPLNARPNSPVDDRSTQASPVSATRTSGVYVAPQTPVPITLEEDVDSGRVKQGQDVKARLSAAVAIHGGPALPAGTPVELSVIAAVPAGRMMAQGELSLQVLRVGNVGVFTDTLVFDGKPGHQDLPDSAPALGTDAGLSHGAELTFHVQPAPSDTVTLPPATDKDTPGSVAGTAPGLPPPPSQVNSTYGDPNSPINTQAPGRRQSTVTPSSTTTDQQVQHLGQASPAPNQPQPPSGASPTTSPRP